MPNPLSGKSESARLPRELVSVVLPTQFGEFRVRAFESSAGHVYLALLKGAVEGGERVLVRLHSECLTGDALGSLRCDCGVQLRAALRAVAAEGRGVVLYLTGQEGRGIGLVNKLLAYVEQDLGADTFDANVRLGLPADARDYTDAAAVLGALAIRSVRLLSNNPSKADELRTAGVAVDKLVPLTTASHLRNRGYLDAKELRFGHLQPTGAGPVELAGAPVDVRDLLGDVRPRPDRPYVLLKFAQTLDGRIATASGDSKWISGEEERRISHGLRAACDAVLVGVGTILQDDPQLTVRMVPGASPIRVVLDSNLRTPPRARVLSDDAATIVITAPDGDPGRVAALRRMDCQVRQVRRGPRGVDIATALADLRHLDVQSVLVEGGSGVITSLLSAGLVDRLIVSISPVLVGAGVEAVGPLGTRRITDGVQLANRSLHVAGEDVLLSWDVLARG